MKITLENITILPISSYEQGLLKALLIDLEDINKKSIITLYIDWQDWHNEYSPERTDPCPDYYGYYTIRVVEHYGETIGVEMDINELDNSLCVLYNYLELWEKLS